MKSKNFDEMKPTILNETVEKVLVLLVLFFYFIPSSHIHLSQQKLFILLILRNFFPSLCFLSKLITRVKESYCVSVWKWKTFSTFY